MKLLREFSRVVAEADGMSSIPLDKFKDIQKNCRDGANDIEQKWANALELLHRAYKVANVQRPSPEMTDAWKQYEENLQYAVQQLSKARGMDADWRMSAAMFHESEQKLLSYNIKIDGGDDPITVLLKGVDEPNIAQQLMNGLGSEYKYDDNVESLPRGGKYRIIHNGLVQATTNIYISIQRPIT